MGTASFYSIDGDTTNQSIGASYLDINDAIQAEQARRFLDPTSLPTIPENSDATEQARKSSEQLAQVTRSQQSNIPPPRFIATPLGAILTLMGCAGGKEGRTITVGCSDSTYDNIQDAVYDAFDGDTIEVCDGTYNGFHAEGNSLTIKAKDDNSPVIRLVGFEGGYPIIFFENGDQFIFSGFEIDGGIEAAVRVSPNDGANIDLSNLNIHDAGVGIIASGNDVDISIYNVVVYNTISGLWVGGDNESTANLSWVESYNNSSAGLKIFGNDSFSIDADNLSMHDNGDEGTDEGGILIYGGIVSISNSEIANNLVYQGGGIYVEDATLTLTDTIVENNTISDVDEIGGGLQLKGSGTSVSAYNTDWNGTNKPYDVYVGDINSDFDPNLAYKYGIGASFMCEYEVGCTDL